ncbi:MAG: divergent PAP2 family protein [Microcystis panniformis Mp_MB_F_20051200_S9]|jgi:acid phosphatase family membrane protein YuiD|uniref:Divergent PAP2 family protein n=5 Tax=Microcystis TaxID=1125 RepID=A0A841V6M8_MICAE|nr:divergent PAP2 family protein [Microcystis aeruginosa]NCQ95547.1 divergent PAP2 family protein [Microcystis aeruginosa W11-03]NCR55614.1 divergent PAP2 family protein [Microcystis aeruginosa L211-07]NCR94119.1 divergent PAP2 family protein [Microcystis aeruginosa W11-06]TRU85670.1 MAG: divergent PAP2 family protein [Microcystis novacekii Mn_MB_F_20050700_S1D]TRU91727.1 MAG: divergent PAP2 family protein [Microcystis novacekii Mn_MB_F_20050700_S1]TRV00244.1 MAG: divergent PAP2 family protei
MQDFQQVLHNQILLISLLACFTAQGLKALIELIRDGKVSLRYLVSSGGMPSAHSALVGALATGVGLQMGWSSAEFAIAALFAVIVMYDAAGVRQAAGKQARILNQIIDEMFQGGKEFNEERLKELIGHTPFQVLVGLSLGIGIAIVMLCR